MLVEKTIWILEDDPGIQFIYTETLGIRYRTLCFSSLKQLKEKLQQAKAELPDLLLADIKLPDGCFLHFLSSTEVEDLLTVPFVVVSSIDDMDALRFCFEEGALDFICKPFKKSELVVKVEKALASLSGKTQGKRSAVPTQGASSGQGLPFWHEIAHDLTKKEEMILLALAEALEQPVSRSALVQKVWPNTTVHPKTLDVHLYNVRKKIRPLGWSIKSVGAGKWRLSHNRVED